MHPTDSRVLMSQKLALHLILKMNSCLHAFHSMCLLAIFFFPPGSLAWLSAAWHLWTSPGSCLQARRWLSHLTNAMSELSTLQTQAFTTAGQFEYNVGVLVGCKYFINSTKILTYIDMMHWHKTSRESEKMEASFTASKSNVMRENWESENGNCFPCSELRNGKSALSFISFSNLIL